MFKKNDPLVDSVKAVMEHNAKERQIEAAVNEEFGVTSKNALPHEIRRQYDRRLAEAKKCMEEDKAGTVPKTDKDKKLAAIAEPKHLITHKDVLKGRGVIPEKKKEEELEEKWHEESKVPVGKKGTKIVKKDPAAPKAIEEKLTKSMSAGDVISDFVHSKDPKFKGKSTKMRQKMALGAYYGMHPEKSRKKMEEQTVFEEIKSNLEEQLVSVYESGDEVAFADFVSSLSEEQLDILGLAEAMAPSAGGGYGPDSPRKAAPSFAGAKDAAAGAKSTMDFKMPSTPSTTSPSTSVADRISSTAHMGASSTPSTPQATPSVLQSTNKAGERMAAGQNQADMDAKAAARAAEFKKMGGPGGAVAKPGATPAGQKIASQVAVARGGTSTPTAPSATASVSRPSTPRPGMKPGMAAKKPMPSGMSAFQKQVHSGQIMVPGMNEETKPQIKESFEQFLRSKFLKG